jgi:SAM-dependent methyltransferase
MGPIKAEKTSFFISYILILIFLSACEKPPCPRFAVETKKGVEVKFEPDVEAKPIRVAAFITETTDLTDDIDKVLLRLDAVQHRYCALAYEAGKKAKKAKTEEERQKWLDRQSKMEKKSLDALENLKALAMKYDDVTKGNTTPEDFTGAVRELKGEIGKLKEEIKDTVLQKEFEDIDKKVEKRHARQLHLAPTDREYNTRGYNATAKDTNWDEVYDINRYFYGKEPTDFLRNNINLFPGGKALVLAMGEGRNAVFLAEQGYDVEGCDISTIALKKANRLAAERGVRIRTCQADLRNSKLVQEKYDLVTCIGYLQLDLIPQMKAALKPGGMVVMCVHTRYGKTRYLDEGELLHLFRDTGMKIILYREMALNYRETLANIIVQKVE